MKKKIITLIVFFIFLNSLGSSLRDIASDHDTDFGVILSHQPVIACLFLFSNVPVEIVAHLVSEDILLTQTAKPVSKKKAHSQKDSSATFSLCDANAKLYMKSMMLSGGAYHPVPFCEGWCPVRAQPARMTPPGETVIVPLLLLLLFIMLPRNGIRGSSVSVFRYAFYSQLDSQVGFFICPLIPMLPEENRQ